MKKKMPEIKTKFPPREKNKNKNKEDLHKGRDKICAWVERVNIGKVSVPRPPTDPPTDLQIKIPVGLLVD